MCCIVTFNQSHVSLTSPEALTALWKLATSDPTLYKEFTASTHNNMAGEDTELDYFAELEDSGVVDESDTPVDVVIKHIINESASECSLRLFVTWKWQSSPFRKGWGSWWCRWGPCKRQGSWRSYSRTSSWPGATKKEGFRVVWTWLAFVGI